MSFLIFADVFIPVLYKDFFYCFGNHDIVFFCRSEKPLTMEQWHIIHISRTARLAVMKVSTIVIGVDCDYLSINSMQSSHS